MAFTGRKTKCSEDIRCPQGRLCVICTPAGCLGVIWQLVGSFTWKYRGPKITKAVVKKSKTGHLSLLLNMKTYYKAKLGKSAVRNRPMRGVSSPRNRPLERWECGLHVNDREPHGWSDGIRVDEVAPAPVPCPQIRPWHGKKQPYAPSLSARPCLLLSGRSPHHSLSGHAGLQPEDGHALPSWALPASPASPHVNLDAAGFHGNAPSSKQLGYQRQ